jgi:hypothetical protein
LPDIRVAEPDTRQPVRDEGCCIAYRSWNVIRNVGDAITPYLIELMSDATPYYARTAQPHLIGVGSIMSMATPESTIWGTGIITPEEYLAPLERGQIRAVRGKKTAELLRRAGIPLGDIPLGDPGIFAADILARENLGAPAAPRKIAVVPHHSSISNPFYQRLRHSNEVCLVNVCDDGLLPLQQIAEADIVVSESLHGLIFAESFGKKAVWVARDEDDPHFKYHDWFSTVRNRPARPAGLHTDFDSLLARAERQHSAIDKTALRAAFPSELGATGVVQQRVPFRTCRQHSPFILVIEMPGPAEDDEPGSNILGFFDRAKAAWDRELQNWAERPYILAVARGRGALPTPARIAEFVDAMDRSHTTDIAILAPRETDTVTSMLIRPLYGRRPSSWAFFVV